MLEAACWPSCIRRRLQMRTVKAVKTVDIPDGVEVKVEGRTVTVAGEKGSLTRHFLKAPITIQHERNTVTVQSEWPRKREAALVGTISSHIQNMIIGVTEGFTYKMKIVFSHFPISLKVQGTRVAIENFTGERSPRWTKIIGDTKIVVKGDDVIVQGINLEDVSQTAANIERATKVKKKDPRVFLDGIFIYEKGKGLEET